MISGPVVVLLVSLTLWTVVGGATPPLTPDDSIVYFTKANFTIKNVETKERKVVSFDLGNTTLTTSQKNETTGPVTLDFSFGNGESPGISVTDFNLTLVVVKGGGYWSVTNYTLSAKAQMDKSGALNFENMDMISYGDMSAPLQRSFHCGRFGPIFRKLKNKEEDRTFNFTPSIELLDFQFQPFLKKVNGTSVFGRSYDCVGFFSIGILSGIFITILLMGIITWGIVMIMNVNTMDRFDDPKGKQITVTATD